MTPAAEPLPSRSIDSTPLATERESTLRRWLRRLLDPGVIGAVLLAAIALPCLLSAPYTLAVYALDEGTPWAPPSWELWMGSDQLGRSLLIRCLLGGAISLSIGIAAACQSVIIGVLWGAAAGYLGGRVDALMMRIVDVLYGLPYMLLVVLIDMALTQPFRLWFGPTTADVLTLMVAIGSVSWLTLARVIRGQVLSLRAQPFLEAARAYAAGPTRILSRHLLPNLVGPIVVYTTLTVPMAILQESLLSFLGIGVSAPLPSWGRLVADSLTQLHSLNLSQIRWWLIIYPCALLGLTLLALNFLGDALRARFDPKHVR